MNHDQQFLELPNSSSSVPPESNLDLPGESQSLREISFSASTGITLLIPVEINGLQIPAIVDTAAQVSIINQDLLAKLEQPLDAVE